MHHTPSQMSCLMLHGALLCDGHYSILHFKAVLISYATYRLNLLFTEGYSFFNSELMGIKVPDTDGVNLNKILQICF